MSLAEQPIGRLPIAGEESPVAPTRPRHRTTLAKADIVSDPEAR